MSRSGYSDDCDGWALIRWRGAVASAIRGARGQAFIREALAALDALEEKRLASDSLVNFEVGAFCTLGAVGHARGMDLNGIDAEDRRAVAAAFGISEALAAEIMYMNDESLPGERHQYVNVEICGPLRPWEPRVRAVRLHDARVDESRWWRMHFWLTQNLNDRSAA